MSIETLNDSLELNIPLFEEDVDVIQKLDDEPNAVGGLTAQELKAEFDKPGNIIKTYLNETLVPAISGTVAEENIRSQNENIRIQNEEERVRAEELRQENAQKFTGLEVSAETLPVGTPAEVTKTLEDGVYHLSFGLPAGVEGPPGVSGVYVGPGEMPEGYNVQVDPSGEVYEADDYFDAELTATWSDASMSYEAAVTRADVSAIRGRLQAGGRSVWRMTVTRDGQVLEIVSSAVEMPEDESTVAGEFFGRIKNPAGTPTPSVLLVVIQQPEGEDPAVESLEVVALQVEGDAPGYDVVFEGRYNSATNAHVVDLKSGDYATVKEKLTAGYYAKALLIVDGNFFSESVNTRSIGDNITFGFFGVLITTGRYYQVARVDWHEDGTIDYEKEEIFG